MIIRKLTSIIKGLVLTARHRKELDVRKLFENKRVAVVGPANSLYDTANGELIDGYDYVIRINKAVVKWPHGKESYTGHRTDILFHSLYENMDSGGGPLDFTLYADYGVQYVVNPHNNYAGWRLAFNFYKKYLSTNTLYVLPKELYNECIVGFGQYVPTIGFTALHAALVSPCRELFVTGFTFFRTPYAPDYRENLTDMRANAAHIKAQGLHDPELELRQFIHTLNSTPVRDVILDQQLAAIIKSETEQ